MITLEQLVAPDSWARIIDLFVDILPIDKLGVKHVKLQSEGRPPYNPVTLRSEEHTSELQSHA